MGQHTGEECFPLQLDQGKTTVARPWHKVLWFGLPQVVTDAKILLVHGKFKAQKDLCFQTNKGQQVSRREIWCRAAANWPDSRNPPCGNCRCKFSDLRVFHTSSSFGLGSNHWKGHVQGGQNDSRAWARCATWDCI